MILPAVFENSVYKLVYLATGAHKQSSTVKIPAYQSDCGSNSEIRQERQNILKLKFKLRKQTLHQIL